MFKISKSLFFSSFIVPITIMGVSAPAEAAGFFDDFDDGIINTSVYTPLGGSVLTESNGDMSLNLTNVGDGVSVLFPEGINCMIFSFDPLGFESAQGLTFTVLEDNSKSLEVSLFETNSLKVVMQPFDKEGKPGNPFEFISSEVKIDGEEVSVNGKKLLRLDWIEDQTHDSMKWNVDVRDEGIPEPLVQSVLYYAGLYGRTTKTVNITFNGSKDPSLSFQQIVGKEIHAVPEPPTILGLVAAMGFGAYAERKRKPSKSSKKDNTKTS